MARGNRATVGALAALAAVLLSAACREAPPELTLGDSAARPAQVVAFDPPQGATGVDPGRTTLSVTFDRQMDPGGWAWVIENESTAPEIGASSWDPAHRTSTVEARLEPGRTYVLWVNFGEYDYFKDLQGVPAAATRWSFSTAPAAGGDGPVALAPAHASLTAPRVVELDPPNGGVDVDPATARLRVRFDRPMAEGWSWVRDSEASFPPTTGRASQSADRREAYLPVALEPGARYVVWLNSDEHRDFRDLEGATLPPVRWSFSTRPLPSD